MAYFGNKAGGDRRGGGGGFKPREYGRPPQGGGFSKPWENRGAPRGDRGDVEMFSATCSDCSKTCEVPFRPNGTKPVFCNDCFGAKKGAEMGDRGGDRGGRPDRREFGNDRPAPAARPAFEPARASTDESKKHLEALVIKVDALTRTVDTLVTMMSSHAHNSPAAKPVAPAAAVVAVKKEVVKETPKAVAKPAAKKVTKKVPATKGKK